MSFPLSVDLDFLNISIFTVAGIKCCATVKCNPVLHYSVAYIVCSFGIIQSSPIINATVKNKKTGRYALHYEKKPIQIY